MGGKQSAGFIGFAGPGGMDLRFSRPRNSSRLADTAAHLVQSHFRAANDPPCLTVHQSLKPILELCKFRTNIELKLYSCHVTRRSRRYRRATLPTVITNFANA
jgi:hypothetical protein